MSQTTNTNDLDNSTAVAQLAAATQAANLAAQQKSLADSLAAIRKDNMAVPDSGYAGDIKPGDKAGCVEAAMLAARAVSVAAGSIVKRIGTKGGSAIILYGGSDLPDFQPLMSYGAQYQTVDSVLNEAIAKLDDQLGKADKLGVPRSESPEVAMIGAGLDAVNKILGFFRTDYSIQGVTVSTDDLLLVNALAGALSDQNVKVSLPALYNSPALLGGSLIITNLNALNLKRVALQQKLNIATAAVDALNTAAGKDADDAKKQAKAQAAADLKTALEQGKVSVLLYDGFLAKLTTADEKAKVPLAAIIQQDIVRNALKGGANLMTAKMSSAGGTYYTRKNLWSFFGAMPFFVRGGVVVNYTLFDGRSGVVLSAGAIPVDGGFFKIGKLPEALKGTPPETPSNH